MCLQVINDQKTIDLSIVEQEICTGGKLNNMQLDSMSNIFSNGFPNHFFQPLASQQNNNTNETIQAYHTNVGTVLN